MAESSTTGGDAPRTATLPATLLLLWYPISKQLLITPDQLIGQDYTGGKGRHTRTMVQHIHAWNSNPSRFGLASAASLSGRRPRMSPPDNEI
ncbi:uncharacterized protein N7473_005192 [Penicillium subrubescens]|uniref:Uncharacterized protein n=1 Tax=Penicillium subrubescens TaxID=1316194 RepID=A0A1Q5UMK7_9EURO|nr:uncharacterized protein N7473_005192 [Penicillium subrubescens]KAJ5895793.1 hypothetical protein N7473_005192 [Penicillium subrubescens]OKP13684.1 hypothetical protein PENSUB_875 [Penicillium subrubescens]